MKTPHLCPICKKEVKQRPGRCTPIYCCKKHYLQATHQEEADTDTTESVEQADVSVRH